MTLHVAIGPRKKVMSVAYLMNNDPNETEENQGTSPADFGPMPGAVSSAFEGDEGADDGSDNAGDGEAGTKPVAKKGTVPPQFVIHMRAAMAKKKGKPTRGAKTK